MTGSTTTPMTDDSTGAMPTTSAMEGSGSGSTGVATTDADTTAGETTSGGECQDEPPPLMGEIDPLCVAYYEQLGECYRPYPQACIDLYAAQCQYYLEYAIMEYGEACGMALLDLYACITALSCEELAMGAACGEQVDAINSTCVP